jgi:hypothetical protein
MRFTQSKCLAAAISVLAALSLFNPCAIAQSTTTGSVTVTVVDPSGSAVPNAQLEIKDVSTNVMQKAATGATGTYTFPSLSFGMYQLTVSAQGFQTQVFSSVQVVTSLNTTIQVPLKLGATSESVTVSTSEVPLVEAESNVLADTIDTKQVTSLPLQGRSMFALAFLVPGWSSAGPGSTAGTWDNMPGGAIVSADYDGTQAISNRFRSGGFTYGSSVVTPRIEDVAEMTVQTAQLDLSGNGTAAMKISMVTRRGSNAFHGRVWDDFQNTDLNANSWLNNARLLPRNIVKLNDFGGSVGGPIWKNKLFFFGTYAESKQPLSVTATANGSTGNVLSLGAQQGIFQYKATNGSTQSVNVMQLGVAAGGTSVINSSVASQFAAINGVLGDGTLTATSDPNLSTLSWQYAARATVYYPAMRFDFNATDKLRLSLSYSQQKTVHPGNYASDWPGGIDTIDQTSSNGNDKIAGFGVDYTIRPTLINQFHAGYMYQASFFSPENLGLDDSKVTQSYFAYGSCLYAGSYPRQAISSYYPMLSWSDTLTWQHGNHTIVAGGGYYHEQDHYWNGAGGYPGIYLGYAGTESTYSPLIASLAAAGLNTTQQGQAAGLYATLIGQVDGVYIDGGGRPLNPATGTYKQYGAYNLDEVQQSGNIFVQDRWRLKPNLTLNFGFRNDMVGDDHDLNGAYANASPANLWGPTTVGAIFQPGTLGGIANPTFNSHVHAYATQWLNAQPAAALAWSPKFGGLLGNILPDGKTVIRTGWSKRMYQEGAQNFWAYASNSGSFFFQSGQAVPDTTGAVGTFLPGSLKLGQTLPQYALFPQTWAPNLPESTLSFNSSFFAMNPNIRQPYVEQWNFGIERQVGAGSALEVRYVGNEGQHAWFSYNLNEVDTLNNGFLQEFQNAQSNLAISQAAGKGNSFANQGLAGQVPLPIFAAAFGGVTTGSLYTQFTTQLKSAASGGTGAVGTVANTLASTQSYICNMFGAKFSPCAALGLGGAGSSYPINFWEVNPFATGNSVNYLDAVGHSNYHSLQVELRQRYWHGMQFNLNYTLSHSLVLGPVNGYQANAGGSYLTDRNLQLSYRPSTYDIRNIFHASGGYDLPFGKGKPFLSGSKLGNEVLGGWNLSTIIIMQSGPPVQFSGGYATLNSSANSGVVFAPGVTGQQIQNAVRVSRTGNPWVLTVNPSLIAANGGVSSSYYTPNVTAGQLANFNYIYGPHWFNADAALNKSIPIRESVRMTIQAQFLNVFNHPAFSMGSISATSLSYGQSTSQISSTDYRRIELRANIEF